MTVNEGLYYQDCNGCNVVLCGRRTINRGCLEKKPTPEECCIYEMKPVWWGAGTNTHLWTIFGLKREDTLEGIIEPNTELWLLGHDVVMNTYQDVMEAMYRILYDEYQINDFLKEGDIIFSQPRMFQVHWYPKKKIKIPAMRFVCEHVHVLFAHNNDARFEKHFSKETWRYI